MRDSRRNFRYGFRALRRPRVFIVLAVLSLMLVVAAKTAIFEVLLADRSRNLPATNGAVFTQVDTGDMNNARSNSGMHYTGVTNPIWEEIKDGQHVFTGVFGWSRQSLDLAHDGDI